MEFAPGGSDEPFPSGTDVFDPEQDAIPATSPASRRGMKASIIFTDSEPLSIALPWNEKQV
jgi:hypothetical protein